VHRANRCLPYRLRAHVRNAIRRCHRHVETRCGRRVCAGRAAACGMLARAAKRASGRSGSGGSYASQVRDQNTHGLRSVRCSTVKRRSRFFRRLLVGSESTLAFIAEAVLETVAASRMTSVAWVPVPTIDESDALVPGLVNLGASAIELMVAPALTAAGQAFAETPPTGAPSIQKPGPVVEIGAEDSVSLEATQHQVLELVSSARLIRPVEFHQLARPSSSPGTPRGTSGFGRQESPGRFDAHHGRCLFSTGAFGAGCARTCRNYLPGMGSFPASRDTQLRQLILLSSRISVGRRTVRYSAFMTELVDLVVTKHDGS